MPEIPKFLPYGEGDPRIEDEIQPSLPLRDWGALSRDEKKIVLQELVNRGWLKKYSQEVLVAAQHLNSAFLRQCPAKHLHASPPKRDGYGDNDLQRREAAREDFIHILLNETSDAMVLRMLSKFAESHIDAYDYRAASKAQDEAEQKKLVEAAFENFDRLANCLNHIFEQFAVNQVVTRSGFGPRQEKAIMDRIYAPTLQALAAPKWRTVSDNLAKMFDDFGNKDYPEAITKAHSVVHRFLQILAGEEGKGGKGEVRKLFAKAKSTGAVPIDRFTEPFVNVLQSYFPSERATNSTAKPALKDATSSDALLMMNLVMIFLQHCLQAGVQIGSVAQE